MGESNKLVNTSNNNNVGEQDKYMQDILMKAEAAAAAETLTVHAPSGIEYFIEIPDNIELIKFVSGKVEMFQRWQDDQLESGEFNELVLFFKRLIALLVRQPQITLTDEPGKFPYDKIPKRDRNMLLLEVLKLIGLDKQTLHDIDFFRAYRNGISDKPLISDDENSGDLVNAGGPAGGDVKHENVHPGPGPDKPNK